MNTNSIVGVIEDMMQIREHIVVREALGEPISGIEARIVNGILVLAEEIKALNSRLNRAASTVSPLGR